MSVSQVWDFFVKYADKFKKGSSCTFLIFRFRHQVLESKCCTWVNVKHQNPFDLALPSHKDERCSVFL